MRSSDRDRIVLAAVVFAVMFSQLLLYPGIATLVETLRADATSSPFAATPLDASMWFLVAEFAAYVAFVGVWGVVSDVTGRRTPLIVVGAIAGAAGTRLSPSFRPCGRSRSRAYSSCGSFRARPRSVRSR